MRQFEKYKTNLAMVTSNHDGYDYITSYGTKVGKVDYINQVRSRSKIVCVLIS